MMSADEFQEKSIEAVKVMWHLYLLERTPGDIAASFAGIPENMMVIGTGHHEFYRNKQEYIESITDNQIDGREIQFMFVDEWYEAQHISDDVCVVYGKIWVREKAAIGKFVLVDMPGTRFTVVCRKVGDDVQICNVHHSVAYLEQAENEYYPKRLTTIANEAVKKSETLERRLQLDHMTEIYNRIYMERHVTQALAESDGYFFLIDLDNFKSINDTKGHLAGDAVIVGFADILKNNSGFNSLVGRMGGDEFAIWDSSIRSKQEAEELFNRILKECVVLSAKVEADVNCSAGVVAVQKGAERFESLYQRCDAALYAAKDKGKRCLEWG